MSDERLPHGNALLRGTRRRLVKAGAAVAWTVPVMQTVSVAQATGTVTPCGCTPGYWKNNQSQWPQGLSPSTTFLSAFNISFNSYADCRSILPNLTLESALCLGGGGINAFTRHAAAALLNIRKLGTCFPINETTLRTWVVNAFANCADPATESRKDVLAGYNQAGCPLPGDPAAGCA